jgi:hypothetical protein
MHGWLSPGVQNPQIRKIAFIYQRCLGLKIFTWLISHWGKSLLVTLCIQTENVLRLKHENYSRYPVNS